jgi:hypothetical protein
MAFEDFVTVYDLAGVEAREYDEVVAVVGVVDETARVEGEEETTDGVARALELLLNARVKEYVQKLELARTRVHTPSHTHVDASPNAALQFVPLQQPSVGEQFHLFVVVGQVFDQPYFVVDARLNLAVQFCEALREFYELYLVGVIFVGGQTLYDALVQQFVLASVEG